MKRCAFLTLEPRGDFVIDDELAFEPLAALGWEAELVPWRQRERPWSSFELVVIRSTWDYWSDPAGFLAVLEEIAGQTRLANPFELVRWNLAKTYLRELEAAEVGVVPTAWSEGLVLSELPGLARRFGSSKLVVKPVVGANGDDAYRLSLDDAPARLEAIAGRFVDRPCMVQPFLPAITSEGEFSLVYFDGVYSHAILKVPAAAEFRSQEERGAELRAIEPEPSLRGCATRVLATLDAAPLYARADFVRTASGDFALMELELIEPSLYLRMHEAAPLRFARALDAWYARCPRRTEISC